MKILMVCLGNICRSPLAQGILKKISDERKLNLEVDSAGTSAYHIGHSPDPRSIQEAAFHQIDISSQKARQLTAEDLNDFDLILTMDQSNFQSVMSLSTSDIQRDKIKLILDLIEPGRNRSVPDPYYDGGFDHVYGLLSQACSCLVDELIVSH